MTRERHTQGKVRQWEGKGDHGQRYAKTILSLMTRERHAQGKVRQWEGKRDHSQRYAKTILSLMTRERHTQGKVLIIGGGIANFTNVATTFKGIVRALREYQDALIDNNVQVFVRRAGPNFQEGLRIMRELGRSLGIPMYVFGPETHMTAIVGMALGKRPIVEPVESEQHTANFLLPGGSPSKPSNKKVSVTSASAPMAAGAQGESTPSSKSESLVVASPSFKPSAIIQSLQRVEALSPVPPSSRSPFSFKSVQPTAAMSREGSQSKDPVLFTPETKAVIWGMQNRAVQGMLDFDFVCSRKNPSVCAMVYPFTGDHKQKFYWGHTEILIPGKPSDYFYKSMADCFSKHPDASVMVSFASLRSAFESTVEAMSYPQIKTIAIIAEGIPENQTRLLIKQADDKGVTIIGPATVGGIKPGAFKIGNTGGMMDNILSSKLYRPGSVAYVSRSGGMSNELNNIISRHTDGVVEGIAIGGDRYPGTTFMDHLLRYQHNRKVKMLVLLGEVGGDEELRVAEALKNGTLSKPLVGWCIGTCAGMFTTDVQFGHAGASANAECETSTYKNKALKDAGAYVPESFDSLGDVIEEVFRKICPEGIPQDETPPPTVPMDYAWARELGLIRRPASFMTTICDERGQELLYAGIPITDVFKDELGIGGVISLLWFQRRLPPYAFKFFEMSLMLTADHGPAVSGAHNTIVCARAGKDLVSSLVSGLLTIGDRFGGALDGAARQFSSGFDAGLSPNDFVNEMRKKGELIMGIGHRVKSINNPDMRVTILKEYVQKEFPATPMLNYALEVEKITTRKKPNLILNVDGVIATCFVDLLRSSGAFTRQEAEEYIKIGTINGLFVLGRSMGFIGHYLDQRRLKQGLYRHPWDDISYVMPEQYQMNQ
ncbi:unnamed protein product [Cyprideis torosa]|uniref:ATP citrate synthase n=1 Tax=Cyprideis torosa TaxID=163714 RepID=A0A7R8ZMA5_9CRUS|nr:unnamed protein product [Cyprideis torosa]CAG0883929.1 unnamed protein product [Cyprideis torosa]